MTLNGASAAFAGSALAARHDSAFALLETREGRTVTDETFGRPGASPDESARPIFWTGCLSKPVVATAAMMLVDRGAVSLDDPIGRFVPAAGPRVRSATVGELLAHTSGLPRNLEDFAFFDARWLGTPIETAAAQVDDEVPGRRGERMYSSVGYLLLGRAIEVAASMELGAFIAREILTPLGMHDSFYINGIPASRNGEIAPVLAGPAGAAATVFDARAISPRNSMPFAGLFSTARDLAGFVRLFIEHGTIAGRELLRETTVAAMLRERVAGQGIHQALGWFLAFPSDASRDAAPPCGFWHTSSSGSLVAVNAVRDAVVVILGQRLLDADLVPVRVTQWLYAARRLSLAPNRQPPPSSDAPPWMTHFASAGTTVT